MSDQEELKVAIEWVEFTPDAQFASPTLVRANIDGTDYTVYKQPNGYYLVLINYKESYVVLVDGQNRTVSSNDLVVAIREIIAAKLGN